MSYIVFKHNKEYGPRKGLEGPFHYPNGRVAYLEAYEAAELQNSIFGMIKSA